MYLSTVDGSFQSMSILKESMNGSVPRLDSDIAVDDDRSPREKTKDLLETVTDRLASHESGLVTDSFGDRDRRQVFGSVVHGQVDCSSQKRFDLSILDIRVVDEPDQMKVIRVKVQREDILLNDDSIGYSSLFEDLEKHPHQTCIDSKVETLELVDRVDYRRVY